MSKKREVKILGLSYAQSSVGSYVCVLAEKRGNRKLPLIIKPNEAHIIALKVEGVKTPRPSMVDIFKNSFDAFGIDCQEVVIYKVAEGIFYTRLLLYDGIDVAYIESTAGEAITIALSFDCPIYIEEEVMDSCGIVIDDEGNIQSNVDDIDEYDNDNYDNDLSIRRHTSKSDQVITLEELEKMMQAALEREEYEVAAELRDKIAEKKNVK
jgi:bifunctional DNase/RNase